jgi:hypothetical protein
VPVQSRPEVGVGGSRPPHLIRLKDIIMEVGNCRLKINKLGSDVPKNTVTPAEVQVLRKAFFESANGDPITEIEVFGTTKRSDANEVQRLRTRYGSLKPGKDAKAYVETMYPGETPRLPQTFEELGGLKIVRGQRAAAQDYNPEPKGEEVIVSGEDVDAFVDAAAGDSVDAFDAAPEKPATKKK